MGEQGENAGPVACRGLRGATTVDSPSPAAVAEATGELLDALVEGNDCRLDDIAAAIFTLTDDLTGSGGGDGSAANPAAAARAHGWDSVPMLSVREQAGDGSLPRCIRVLILWNTARSQRDVRHVYLRGARILRPDLSDRLESNPPLSSQRAEI